MSSTINGVTLRTISGPAAADRDVPPDQRITIGRSVSCDLCLLDGTVSREHAALTWSGDRGIVVDLNSSRGTFLNGIKLESQVPTAIAPGDLLTIGPWTFRIHAGDERIGDGQTVDDTGALGMSIQRLPSTMSTDPREGRLQLLIDCIASLNAADDEAALAIRRDSQADEPFAFSRSLVREATKGHVVSLNSGDFKLDGRSVAELGIQTAIALPIELGGTVAAVLYLDSRRGERSSEYASSAYCEAVARACGLAMAKLKRGELERRQLVLHQEMAAAREVQRVLVPPEVGRHGSVRYSVRMRPGLFVAGDLFDVFPLADGRVGVFIGDVSGHGLGPALVMAMTQSHIHAHLAMHEDPGRVVEEVNRYVADHVADGRYVSLWLGVIWPDGEMRYVDAGHGHWGLVETDPRRGMESRIQAIGPGGAVGGMAKLAGAIPMGIDPSRRFVAETARLGPGHRLVLYSDGIVEQRNDLREEFGAARVLAAAAHASDPAGVVEAVTRAMDAFAGGITPGDDATVACIMVDPA